MCDRQAVRERPKASRGAGARANANNSIGTLRALRATVPDAVSERELPVHLARLTGLAAGNCVQCCCHFRVTSLVAQGVGSCSSGCYKALKGQSQSFMGLSSCNLVRILTPHIARRVDVCFHTTKCAQYPAHVVIFSITAGYTNISYNNFNLRVVSSTYSHNARRKLGPAFERVRLRRDAWRLGLHPRGGQQFQL